MSVVPFSTIKIIMKSCHVISLGYYLDGCQCHALNQVDSGSCASDTQSLGYKFLLRVYFFLKPLVQVSQGSTHSRNSSLVIKKHCRYVVKRLMSSSFTTRLSCHQSAPVTILQHVCIDKTVTLQNYICVLCVSLELQC